MIDDQVQVDPLPPQDVHGLFVLQLVKKLLDDVERQSTRVNNFQISSRHLQNGLGVFWYRNDKAGSSFHHSDRFGVPEGVCIDGLVEDRLGQRQRLQRVAEGRRQQEVGMKEKRTEKKFF